MPFNRGCNKIITGQFGNRKSLSTKAAAGDSTHQKDYEFLDCGNLKRLERFGGTTISITLDVILQSCCLKEFVVFCTSFQYEKIQGKISTAVSDNHKSLHLLIIVDSVHDFQI